MRLALRELRRRPRRFALPVGILLLLALLLLYPSAILDSLYASSTGALRALPADLVVYSKDSHRSLGRSRIPEDVRMGAGWVPGVIGVGPLDTILLSGRVDDHDEAVGLAILGVGLLKTGARPEPGKALVDDTLQSKGAHIGSTLLIGPFKVPIEVSGFSHDSNLLAQGGVFVDEATWRSLLSQARPDAALGDGVSQALLLSVDRGSDPLQVASAFDRMSGGNTDTMTVDAAIKTLPGLEQQRVTFSFLRTITLTVALIVVALFLSFITLERTPLYAVLKAVGASSRQLFGGLVAQVLAMVVAAVLIASVVTVALIVAIPVGIPIGLRPMQILSTTVALGLTAALASCLSLRRVMRVDPATAFA